jgi:hypothetical protein
MPFIEVKVRIRYKEQKAVSLKDKKIILEAIQSDCERTFLEGDLNYPLEIEVTKIDVDPN